MDVRAARKAIMKVEHVALWARDIDEMQKFYCRYFSATSGPFYINERKHFRSCFLRFDSGARLELMQRPDIVAPAKDSDDTQFFGYAHLAMSVGSEEAVNALTRQLLEAGHIKLDGPRWTGDGYYESVILDPEGNRIEITV
jgi:lactoylglutathione lyase